MKITKLKNTKDILEVKVEMDAFYKSKQLCAATVKNITEHAIKNKWIDQEQIDFVAGSTQNNKMEDISTLYVFHKKLNKKESVPIIRKRSNKKTNVKKDESK